MSWLRRLVRRHVEKTVDQTVAKVVDEKLPTLVEKIITEKHEREPNLPLTEIGFSWALSIALRKHWPNLDGKTASRWLWDYIDVPFGAKGYRWSYAGAQELALQYVQEFGEAA